jgi:undecaprenyl diphosphate synthase
MKKNIQGLHIGLIMDGNGRWATQQDKPRLYGHAKGVQTVVEVVRQCPSLNVHTVTLFAFAISNWKRDKEEVDGLWELFHHFITETAQELLEKGAKITFIGNREGLPERVKIAAEKLEDDSKENGTVLLQIALNYDGVDEVARLVQRTIEEGVTPEDVTMQYVQTHLDTQADNEPDIIVRTGMPKTKEGMSVWRSSGFLPIQSAQSVCISTEVLWPDFTLQHLQEIIIHAKPNERLFGDQRKRCNF